MGVNEMGKTQDEIFLKGEGDRYFERNGRDSVRKDVVDFYSGFLRSEFNVLEIGCSGGVNLDYFFRTVHCKCYGMDPSAAAIKSGKKRFRKLDLSVGAAEKLAFPDEYFDFVLFGFCLYLVDRHNLAKAVAEADRVLKNKGFLGITDFDAKVPKKRVYKHRRGVLSYKMDYGSLFLAYPQYSFVEKHSFSIKARSFVQEASERASAVILFKDHAAAYTAEADA
jgi:ubiquinone/menaquinone biosynthesis C-methylase UbiE